MFSSLYLGSTGKGLTIDRIGFHDVEGARIQSEIKINKEYRSINFTYGETRVVLFFESVGDLSGFVHDLADKADGIEMMAAFDVLDTMEVLTAYENPIKSKEIG